MIRNIDDFQRVWKYEKDETLKLFSALTDESLSQKATEDGRSLGFLAWHLVCSLGMVTETGLDVGAPGFDSEAPTKASEIIEAFEKGAERVSDLIAANWDDETLLVENEMYGEMWAKGTTLFYLLMHHSHHRGQITILMRLAGLPVHGVYGPSKEEWAEMGMPAMA